MAIGLAYGRDRIEDFGGTSPRLQESLARGTRLCDRFREAFSGLRYWEVQKTIFGRYWDPKQREELVLPETHEKCADVISMSTGRMRRV